MKKLLFVLSAVVLLAAGCSSSQSTPTSNPTQTTPTPNPSNNTPSTEGSITPSSKGYLYTNTDYGFQLNFSSDFEGLRVRVENDKVNSEIKYLRFEVPKNNCTSGGDACYMQPLTVAVYPLSVWYELMKEPPYDQYKVKISNKSYAMSVLGWQDLGENTEAAKQISAAIPAVQASLVVY